ncbi:hypothetical protein Mapa_016156 [Marchantia paleacea]|nr:hypothetical protein Mapa_016156 [Marchantia paleacea]
MIIIQIAHLAITWSSLIAAELDDSAGDGASFFRLAVLGEGHPFIRPGAGFHGSSSFRVLDQGLDVMGVVHVQKKGAVSLGPFLRALERDGGGAVMARVQHGQKVGARLNRELLLVGASGQILPFVGRDDPHADVGLAADPAVHDPVLGLDRVLVLMVHLVHERFVLRPGEHPRLLECKSSAPVLGNVHARGHESLPVVGHVAVVELLRVQFQHQAQLGELHERLIGRVIHQQRAVDSRHTLADRVVHVGVHGHPVSSGLEHRGFLFECDPQHLVSASGAIERGPGGAIIVAESALAVVIRPCDV